MKKNITASASKSLWCKNHRPSYKSKSNEIILDYYIGVRAIIIYKI